MKKTYRTFRRILGIGRPAGGYFMQRPFEKKDMDKVPEGWKTSGPHFVGIGSGKAGTSWWYHLLLQHPEIKPNLLRTKELQYFCHFGPAGMDSVAIENYRQAFAAPENSICGEWSPIYLSYPLAMDHLAVSAPETKLLAIIRNP